MEHAWPIVVQMLSQPRYLCVLRATIQAAAGTMGLAADEADQVVLAVDEAVTNVIRHGYGNRPDLPIVVRIAPTAPSERAGMRVVIEDSCPHVDPAKLQPPPDDPCRPGGLGIRLMRRTMDAVAVDRRDDAPGLRLTMIKWARPVQGRQEGDAP